MNANSRGSRRNCVPVPRLRTGRRGSRFAESLRLGSALALLVLSASLAFAASRRELLRHQTLPGETLWSVAHGRPAFVAVGGHGEIFRSGDGSLWAPVSSGVTDDLMAVTYGAGKFIAVGAAGRVLSSPDGLTWSTVTPAVTTQRLNGVLYGGGRFVAVGEAGTIITSADGIAWSTRESGVTGWLRGIAYAAASPATTYTVGLSERWVITGQGGTVLTVNDRGEFVPDPRLHHATTDDLEAVVLLGYTAWATGAGGVFLTDHLEYNFLFPKGPFTGQLTPLVYSSVEVSRLSPATRYRALVTGPDSTLWAAGAGGVILNVRTGEVFDAIDQKDLASGVAAGNSVYFSGGHEIIVQLAAPAGNRLLNLSARAWVGPGDTAFTAGFVISGPRAKRVLIRQAGPSLARFVTDPLPRTGIFLLNARNLPVTTGNVGWDRGASVAERESIEAATARCGAFPFARGSADSALLLTLAPGVYKAQGISSDGDRGTTLVEVYDLDAESSETSAAVNMSSLGRLDANIRDHLHGFVIAGESERRVLLRAVGPSLAALGTADPLAAPVLELHRAGHADPIAAIHGPWSDAETAENVRAAANLTGAFPLVEGARDAATVVSLPPGVYTAVVTSAVASGNGHVLVEVYDLP